MNREKIELLPCHCGRKVKIKIVEGYYVSDYRYWIRCRCGRETKVYKIKKALIKMWNTRKEVEA